MMNNTDTLDFSTLPFNLWDSAMAAQPEMPEFAGVAMMDSVFCTRPADTSQMRTSIFAGHTLSSVNPGLQARTTPQAPAWPFLVLLLLTALVTLYYRAHKMHLRDLLASLFSYRTMDRTLRNNNIIQNIQLLPTALLAVACVSMVIHQVAMSHTGITTFLLLWGVLMALYMLRNGLVKLLGTLFDNSDSVNLYITSNYLYHLLLATVLVPLLFLQVYLPWGHPAILYVTLGVIAVELIMRIFRGLQLFLTQSNGSHFFLFYYLCTVELAPILVLLKWLIE